MIALQNSINNKQLFEQLKTIKNKVNIPTLLIGFINPWWKFGVESIIAVCEESGVSGIIKTLTKK